MKFKFKPQTALVVGGLLAATYASACYYQGSTAVCFTSGSTVDSIVWQTITDGSAPAPSPVIATQDWHYTASHPPDSLTYYGVSGNPGQHASHTDYNITYTEVQVLYCGGAAKFQDAAGQWTTVSKWINGSADRGSAYTPKEIYDRSTTSGSTTC